MHPTLIYITDSFYIGTYGVLVVIGLLSGIVLASWRASRNGFDPDIVIDVTVGSVLIGMLGGRLMFILTNFSDFIREPGPYIFSRSGFVFLGGLIAGVGTAYFILRRKIPKNIWVFGDVVAPAVPLGHMFGRFGCWFTGCCHGSVCETGNFLAHRFPQVLDRQGNEIGSMAFLTHKYQGLLEPGATWSLPVWPTQLFEAGANLAICFALIWLFTKRRFDGQIILLYGFLYAIARFLIEFLRGDPERGLFLGNLISTSQLIVLCAIPVLIYFWTVRRKSGLTPLPLEQSKPAQSNSPSQKKKKKTRSKKRRNS